MIQKPVGSAMCFDFGTRNIGVAIGQTLTNTATPLGVINNHKESVNWGAIQKYLDEWQPCSIVVGLPLNMDGSKSPFCDRVERFARQLHGRYNLPVELIDERLSTYEAKNREAKSGKHRNSSFKQDPIDGLAAMCIMETWLAQSASTNITERK